MKRQTKCPFYTGRNAATDSLRAALRAVARWTPAAAGVRGHTAHKRGRGAVDARLAPGVFVKATLRPGAGVRAHVVRQHTEEDGRNLSTGVSPGAVSGAQCAPLRGESR